MSKKAKKEQADITLRLPVALLDELRCFAEARGDSLDTLVAAFLRERVELEVAEAELAVHEGPGVYKVRKRGRDFRTAGTAGKRYAVLSAEDWEALVEWLEMLEDGQAVRQPLADLKAAHGSRRKAGWIAWEDAEKEIE